MEHLKKTLSDFKSCLFRKVWTVFSVGKEIGEWKICLNNK